MSDVLLEQMQKPREKDALLSIEKSLLYNQFSPKPTRKEMNVLTTEAKEQMKAYCPNILYTVPVCQSFQCCLSFQTKYKGCSKTKLIEGKFVKKSLIDVDSHVYKVYEKVYEKGLFITQLSSHLMRKLPTKS